MKYSVEKLKAVKAIVTKELEASWRRNWYQNPEKIDKEEALYIVEQIMDDSIVRCETAKE